MGFGQSAGPPASSKQVAQLLALLQDAGYEGFRDARGPLQLTQRQGGGKFTRDEADALIERLEAAAEAPDHEPAATSPSPKAPTRATTPARAPTQRVTAAERALRDMPDALLAAELQRRGWIVVEP